MYPTDISITTKSELNDRKDIQLNAFQFTTGCNCSGVLNILLSTCSRPLGAALVDFNCLYGYRCPSHWPCMSEWGLSVWHLWCSLSQKKEENFFQAKKMQHTFSIDSSYMFSFFFSGGLRKTAVHLVMLHWRVTGQSRPHFNCQISLQYYKFVFFCRWQRPCFIKN